MPANPSDLSRKTASPPGADTASRTVAVPPAAPPPRVYLAGPDVFMPDAEQRYRHLEALCCACGLVGLRPLDGKPLPDLPKKALMEWIARQNDRMIRGDRGAVGDGADAVLANLEPFRGSWADTGTCVEIGIALGLGVPVFTYGADPRSVREKVEALGEVVRTDDAGVCRDAAGLMVEDFEEPENLMICGLVAEQHDSAEAAVQAIAAAAQRQQLRPRRS